MLKRQNPTETQAWLKLKDHFEKMKGQKMQDLFDTDPTRFDKFSIQFEELLLDFSKNIISQETLKLLVNLAKDCGLNDAIQQMFTGAPINETENRSVLHIALRNRSNSPIFVDGDDVMPAVNSVLKTN